MTNSGKKAKKSRRQEGRKVKRQKYNKTKRQEGRKVKWQKYNKTKKQNVGKSRQTRGERK